MTILELTKKEPKLQKFLEKQELGKFSELKGNKNFKFKGIYLILDENKIIYIGSAYTRDVHARLMQYTREKDTGNTLAQDIIDSGYKKTPKEAIEYIMSLNIVAFPYTDFEYDLINKTDSIINKNGFYED